jgi:hypothetical protein
MQYFAVAAQAMIAVVFIAAVWGKGRSKTAFGSFVDSLRDMTMIRRPWSARLAALTLAAEIAAVILLVTPSAQLTRLGFGLSALMLLAFAGAIVTSLMRGNKEPCQCFGRSTTPLGWHHVLRNLFLVAVSVTALFGVHSGPFDLGYTVIAVAGGAVLGVLVTAIDDIAYLFK